jgi:HK97 family phage major capsid protein
MAETPETKKETPAAEAAASTKTPEVKEPVEMRNSKDAVVHRYFRAEGKDFENEDTFQVRMSSEAPAEQRATSEHERVGIAKQGEKFVEVLSHNEGDVDLSRFNGDNRAALLDEHNDKRHLGFVKKAALNPDKVTRAAITFDLATKLSVSRCKQVRSGSRPNFSIGYSHTRYLGTTTLPDGRIGHRFAWQGLELSNVAVPADPTAQKGRSQTTECHCIGCGDIFARNELNNDFLCPDCADAETPAEDSGRKSGGRIFRSKAKDGTETRISIVELESKLHTALDSDKRFKVKGDNGDVRSDFRLQDIHQIVGDGDNDDWQVLVSSPAWSSQSKLYAVDFTYENGAVMLGESTEVELKTTLEAVDRALPFDAKQFRMVDLTKLTTADKTAENLQRNKTIMAKSIAELKNEVPELVAELEKTARAAVVTEYNDASAKVTEANKEVRALANEAVKTYGKRWNGKPGEVYVVGERIRSLEASICAQDASHTASERRGDFKRGLDDLIFGSREPKEQTGAADIDKSLSNRCSLRNLYNAAAKAQRSGNREPMFMPTEGAEIEAHKEIVHRAADYPDGLSNIGEGLHLPMLTPSPIRNNAAGEKFLRGGREHMTRDALAGDFGSAGAFIAPEYVFPYIELLRNKPALARAGMTILSGVMGGLTLPRQTAPTTGQSLAEGAAAAYYDQTLDQIKMSPHRVGSAQKYSRLALLQATPDFEAMVLNDHMAVIGLYIDQMGLNGQGAGDQPLGILNQIGIGSVPFGGVASTAYANCVKLETAIRKANIDDPISFITTSTGRGCLKSTARLLTGATVVAALPVWEDNDTITGRPAWDSQQVPGDILLALAARHIVMAQWGGLSVILNTYSFAKNDEIELSINTYVDFALRHVQAIAKSSDSIAALA